MTTTTQDPTATGAAPDAERGGDLVILQAALQQGHPPEVISQLIALQGEMLNNRKAELAMVREEEERAAKKAWIRARAEARKLLRPILATQENSQLNSRYATIGDVMKAVDPVLGDLGLSYSWKSLGQDVDVVDGRKICTGMTMACILWHEDGYSETIDMWGPVSTLVSKSGNAVRNPLQDIGVTSTYLQRYTLMAHLGVAPTRDTDGSSRDPNAGLQLASREDVADLEAAIRETQTKLPAMLAHYGFARLQDIPSARVGEIIRELRANAKRRAAKRKEEEDA